MATETNDGVLARIYRERVGRPTTHDEVRGYWVFLTGLVLGTLGIVLFLPSTSATGASALTLREVSIFIAAVGLAMLVAGPVIRLPLQSWANYAAYLGQAICFVAAVWFVLVFPAEWSVQTGSQPVILLYAVGLAILMIGGAVVPLVAGVTREDLEASEDRATRLETEVADLEAELDAERDRHESELDAARGETAAGEADRADLQAIIDSMRASQATFELYEDRADEWRWRLRHRNGNIIADGGEGYTRKHNAQKGMVSVRRNALGATTLLFEREAELPEDQESIDPVEERESRATFELYEDNAGEYRFRLRHDNGNIIGDGGEGYASRSNAKRAIGRLKEYVGPADYLWFDPTGFEVYLDGAGEWRWRLVHRNGNILGDGGEGYTRRHDANRAVDRIRNRAADLDAEVYEDNAGEYRWRLLGGDGSIVADSGEGYDSKSGAEDALSSVREYAPDADVLDIGRAAFELYEDRGGDHRWRLRHRNGNILIDSGQGYADRSGARDGIESVKRNAPGAETDA
ncbi:HVO_2922 family protein [Haloplanus salilacus]|uniref:HVO_2922 family protein n=1 Tax=Haloplanus salilacus TaxID=2949994 RepID=UPI0030D56B57